MPKRLRLLLDQCLRVEVAHALKKDRHDVLCAADGKRFILVVHPAEGFKMNSIGKVLG